MLAGIAHGDSMSVLSSFSDVIRTHRRGTIYMIARRTRNMYIMVETVLACFFSLLIVIVFAIFPSSLHIVALGLDELVDKYRHDQTQDQKDNTYRRAVSELSELESLRVQMCGDNIGLMT